MQFSLRAHLCIVVFIHESENWQCFHRLLSRHFPLFLDHVVFKNMENPLIAGRIQLERFISVEVFEKIGNSFRGITCFLYFLENFRTICPQFIPVLGYSEKTATPKMACSSNERLLFQILMS